MALPQERIERIEDQILMAEQLIELFHSDVEAEEVTVDDLLDNLASCGFELRRPPEDEGCIATDAYHMLITAPTRELRELTYERNG